MFHCHEVKQQRRS